MIIIAVTLLLSFWHGRLAGLINLLFALSLHMIGVFYLRGEVPHPLVYINIFSLGLVLSYLGGSLNEIRKTRDKKIMYRFRKNADDKNRYLKISRAQQDIIGELEERVTRQRDSLNLLHERIKEIDCLDTNMSISKLLDTIVHFSSAESLSLWVFDKNTNKLKLRMSKGEEQTGREDTLNLKDTIEGWVFRNNQLFSIRMSLDYENLSELNHRQNIISCPVVLDNKTWGVINIESLPFIKYSEYTENIIQIIVNLAQPALKKALEFESLLLGEEQNSITGLPQFTQLYRELDKNRYDESGTFNSSSLVILEIQGFSELTEKYGLEKIITLQAELARGIAERDTHSPEVFHYREDNRMALYIPHMDYDGCSLFCLETLEYINSRFWTLEGKDTYFEVNIGYSSSGTGEKMDPDDLLKKAEYLLEIQKI
ncbi:MAG: hypothetical protein PQJ50_09075 [Spirochaetales bacterium]|nr:hypothetical protein [Spirochaetales bacterium]